MSKVENSLAYAWYNLQGKYSEDLARKIINFERIQKLKLTTVLDICCGSSNLLKVSEISTASEFKSIFSIYITPYILLQSTLSICQNPPKLSFLGSSLARSRKRCKPSNAFNSSVASLGTEKSLTALSCALSLPQSENPCAMSLSPEA